jgi:hypothetical protein
LIENYESETGFRDDQPRVDNLEQDQRRLADEAKFINRRRGSDKGRHRHFYAA